MRSDETRAPEPAEAVSLHDAQGGAQPIPVHAQPGDQAASFELPWHPDPIVRERLETVPRLLARATDLRATAHAAEITLRGDTPSHGDARGARLRVDALLERVEADIRLTWHAFLVTASPQARRLLAEALEEQRDAADVLRQAARAFSRPPAAAPPAAASDAVGATGMRLHDTLARLRAQGHEPRAVFLSPSLLKRLRRESGGRSGPWSLDVPVFVDFGWADEDVVVRTYEGVTLEEIEHA